jgi:hypothetical protein
LSASIELDLTKAYDRVDWNYLRGALLRMCFDTRWVKLIMKCVTSVASSVRINGELTGKFYPTRGLRQGDPLPLPFLVCGGRMTKILDRAVYIEELRSLKICRSAPSASHLLFTDDNLLFFQANAQQANVIKEALNMFERCTSQLINVGKCSILFSIICPESNQDEIKKKSVRRTTKHF